MLLQQLVPFQQPVRAKICGSFRWRPRTQVLTDEFICFYKECRIVDPEKLVYHITELCREFGACACTEFGVLDTSARFRKAVQVTAASQWVDAVAAGYLQL